MVYPSDVSDREWAEIERFFEPEHIGRPRKHSARSLYNAIPCKKGAARLRCGQTDQRPQAPYCHRHTRQPPDCRGPFLRDFRHAW